MLAKGDDEGKGSITTTPTTKLTKKKNTQREEEREKSTDLTRERERDIPSERRDYTNVYNVALGAN